MRKTSTKFLAVAITTAAIVAMAMNATPAFAPGMVNNNVLISPTFDPNKGSLVSTGEPVVIGDNATMMAGNMTSGNTPGGNMTGGNATEGNTTGSISSIYTMDNDGDDDTSLSGDP